MQRFGRGRLFRLLCGIVIAACGILPLFSAITAKSRVRHFKTCKDLPGANDVLVVFKTGATEFAHKFPVHLNTTLRCYPNYMVFSDHREVYQGQIVHDALEPLGDHMKEHHRLEFELYHRVQESGRQILGAAELSDNPDTIGHKSPQQSYASMGWRLDKWKFLPMFQTAYETQPGFKWYVFIEADTYLFWSSLLQYIARLDHRVASWHGAELFVAGTNIAHGGAGMLISNPGMKLFSDEYLAQHKRWIIFMDSHKGGDVILARLMNTAGLLVTKARPLFNIDAPGNDTYSLASIASTNWCDPVLTYHHVAPEVIKDVWEFEQDFFAHYGGDFSPANDGQQVPKRRDIFIRYIYPQMLRGPRERWDNNCKQDLGERPSFEACRQSCEEQLDCLQFRYDSSTKHCFVKDVAQLGDEAPASTWQSGWLTDRIYHIIEQAPTCDQKGWTKNS